MIKRYNFICSLILVVVGIIFLTLLCFNPGKKISDLDYYTLDGGWNITINDKKMSNIVLSETSFDITSRGDKVIIENILPQNGINYPVLEFCASHCTVQVEIDGIERYSYGIDRLDDNKFVGYGYHYIDLPRNYYEKNIKITLIASDNNAFRSIDAPRICNGINVKSDFVQGRTIPLIINIFVIVFGFILLCIVVVLLINKRWMPQLMSISLLSIGVGIWSFCNYELTFLISDAYEMRNYLEFATLYISAIFILWYFKEQSLKYIDKIRIYGYYVLMAMLLCFNIIVWLSEFLGMAHLPDFIHYCHILLISTATYILVILAQDIKKKRFENYTIVVSLIIVIIFALIDIIKYNIEKYISSNTVGGFTGITCIGVLTLIIALIMDFCIRMFTSIKDVIEYNTLENVVYTDALTGLYNRNFCEEEFDDLDKNKHVYALIKLDINNVKYINETYGREQGDRYIKYFANIIQNIYGRYGTVARLGGDEFIVIIKNASTLNVDILIERMQNKIDTINSKIRIHDISTAYGVSTYDADKTESSREALRLADARMYQKKKEMKMYKNK